MKRSRPSKSFSLPDADLRGLLGQHETDTQKASFPAEGGFIIQNEFSHHDKDASCSFAHGYEFHYRKNTCLQQYSSKQVTDTFFFFSPKLNSPN